MFTFVFQVSQHSVNLNKTPSAKNKWAKKITRLEVTLQQIMQYTSMKQIDHPLSAEEIQKIRNSLGYRSENLRPEHHEQHQQNGARPFVSFKTIELWKPQKE
jgi:hypothetical protein